MTSIANHFWKVRVKAGCIHFAISTLIAVISAALVFGLWYPYPYREISGGRELFSIVVIVDVLLGPLITLAIFNPSKSRRELRLDLFIVALLQLGALCYGMWTVFVARPVHMVFEYDRFRIVHAVDIPSELLNRAPPNIEVLPKMGPTLLSLRPFVNSDEKMKATMVALEGISLSAQPGLWQPYADAKSEIWKASKPISELKTRFSAQAAAIDAVIASTGRRPETLAYLPLVGRQSFWTVFFDPVSGEMIAYMPLDSF